MTNLGQGECEYSRSLAATVSELSKVLVIILIFEKKQ